MKRRNAIRSTAFLAGCGLSAGTIASIISGCKSEPKVIPRVTFLGDEYVSLLGDIVETILPATDTPGAREAEVHYFIDDVVKNNFISEEQVMIKEALDLIKLGSNDKEFAVMSSEERELFLLGIDDKYVEEEYLRDGNQDTKPRPYQVLRGLTCQGYFTSEMGAKQALAYDPIPLEYIPCMDLSEIGKGWAL